MTTARIRVRPDRGRALGTAAYIAGGSEGGLTFALIPESLAAFMVIGRRQCVRLAVQGQWKSGPAPMVILLGQTEPTHGRREEAVQTILSTVGFHSF